MTAPAPMSRNDFVRTTGFPEPLMARLDLYLERLIRWQAKINLVGAKTLNDPWRRHFLDSAQMFEQLPSSVSTIADLGSGAGFPGMVLALQTDEVAVHLIESDQRKAVFLREINRETGAGATVHSARIEACAELGADLVTARACAPLSKLLGYAEVVLAPGGQCLFLKGRSWREELTEAEKQWTMAVETIPSRSDDQGVILKLNGLSRRG